MAWLQDIDNEIKVERVYWVNAYRNAKKDEDGMPLVDITIIDTHWVACKKLLDQVKPRKDDVEGQERHKKMEEYLLEEVTGRIPSFAFDEYIQWLHNYTGDRVPRSMKGLLQRL